MADDALALGLNFSGNNIYFAANDPQNNGGVRHIGRIELNFPVLEALNPSDEELVAHISKAVNRLKKRFDATSVRVLTLPQYECWTTLPRLVCDDPSEREAHLAYFINGYPRQSVEMYWHEMSNQDFRFLAIRERKVMKQFEGFVGGFGNTEFCSDFEIGLRWVRHSMAKGSFMCIGCHSGAISIASYLLGKLRAATYIRFRHPEDLPYLWKQSEAHLRWMKGYHEEIILFGTQTGRVLDILRPFWDVSAEISVMDNLASMNVMAEEETYSFPLEEAFPSIMLAVNS